MRFPRLFAASVLLILAHPALAAWRVATDFEGGDAEVVHLDEAARVVRIQPALREGRGWPCWWYFRLSGLSVGQEFTLEVQAQPAPYREQTVLAAAWCQPRHAWLCSDGKTWVPSARGALGKDKVMSYVIKAAAETMALAWGPPFVPTDAETLLAEIAARVAGVQRFVLATTRGGRPVQGIRLGDEAAPRQVWVQARQHAWEAGSSHVGRGFIRWCASDEPAARALRERTCVHFIPIMDVDNVAIGAGGKEAIPRDHNRDWGVEPIYPEVAAAQARLRKIHEARGLDVFVDLHNPGASDPTFFFGPFDFTTMSGIKRRNYQRWVELAAGQVTTPEPVAPAYRFATYVQTDEERSRMSGEWVRTHTSPHTIATTLETGWNSPLKSTEGYGEIGAGLGRALAAYLAEDPRREAE
jgi:hypothetical protein